MSSPQITRTGAVSPVLAIVIEALEHQADRAGEAAALRDFGDLAIREIVAHIIAGRTPRTSTPAWHWSHLRDSRTPRAAT